MTAAATLNTLNALLERAGLGNLEALREVAAMGNTKVGWAICELESAEGDLRRSLKQIAARSGQELGQLDTGSTVDTQSLLQLAMRADDSREALRVAISSLALLWAAHLAD
jgi:hypothetical protein